MLPQTVNFCRDVKLQALYKEVTKSLYFVIYYFLFQQQHYTVLTHAYLRRQVGRRK